MFDLVSRWSCFLCYSGNSDKENKLIMHVQVSKNKKIKLSSTLFLLFYRHKQNETDVLNSITGFLDY